MKNMNNLRIRKLTPKECWRLMGFDDEDFENTTNLQDIEYELSDNEWDDLD